MQLRTCTEVKVTLIQIDAHNFLEKRLDMHIYNSTVGEMLEVK